ncbi:MAG TPA: hypothetical protein VK709_16115 [Candidatus Saccharimonadales bacterium]|jgi:hypothetical protein|nr:hypothetical protein [Candidatus Saccharimonadales bacterium]
MKNKWQLNESIRQLEHRGGKKLAQQNTEFSHKKREVRKHRTGGARGK